MITKGQSLKPHHHTYGPILYWSQEPGEGTIIIEGYRPKTGLHDVAEGNY